MINTFGVKAKALVVPALVSVLSLTSLSTIATEAGTQTKEVKQSASVVDMQANSESKEQVIYMDTLTSYSHLQKNLRRRNIKTNERRYTQAQPVEHDDIGKPSSVEITATSTTHTQRPPTSKSLISETAID